MKTTLFLFGFFFISFFTVNAQITYEDSLTFTSPGFNAGLIRFQYAGDKYWVLKSDSIIEIYNLNHTLYKSITIPPSNIYGNSYTITISYLSETLFDTDSTTIEYLMLMQESVPTWHLHMHVYSETGASLFFMDSCTTWYNPNVDELGYINKPVFNTDSGTKMMLRRANGTAPTGPYLFYSLPGRLYTPCDCYDASGMPLVVDESGAANRNCILKNYPNPAGDKTIIEYTLPKNVHEATLKVLSTYGTEIKTYRITDMYSTIELDNSDLPQGNYFYQVILPNGTTAAKKMMVIR